MSNEDFFKNTPLGQTAEQSETEKKPKVEEFERDFLRIKIDRRRTDGVVEVRLSGAADPTEFHIKEGNITYGTVDHYGQQDIDKKADDELLQAHAKTVWALIKENKI